MRLVLLIKGDVGSSDRSGHSELRRLARVRGRGGCGPAIGCIGESSAKIKHLFVNSYVRSFPLVVCMAHLPRRARAIRTTGMSCLYASYG